MKKDLLLSLGTIAALATPVATVIACGASDDDKDTTSVEDIEKKVQEVLGAFFTSALTEVEFSALALDGSLETEIEKIQIGVKGQILDVEVLKTTIETLGSSLDKVTVKKSADSLNVTYSMSVIDDFTVTFTGFTEAEKTDAEKVAAVKANIESFTVDSIDTELSEADFLAKEILEADKIELAEGAASEDDDLKIEIPGLELNGTSTSVTKAATTADLTFTIISGTETEVVTYTVTKFDQAPETDLDKVNAVKTELESITFDSALEDAPLQAVTVTDQNWDGTTAEIANIEATSSSSISNMKGTTITLTKAASTLDVTFEISLGSESETVTRTLVAKAPTTPVENPQEDVDAVEADVAALSITKSTLDETALTDAVYTNASWDGADLTPTELEVDIQLVQDLMGTKIEISKAAGSLDLTFVISKDGATSATVTHTLEFTEVVVDPADQTKADAIVAEIEAMTFTSAYDDHTIGSSGSLTDQPWDGLMATDLHLTELNTFSSADVSDMTGVTITFNYEFTTDHQLTFTVKVGNAIENTTTDIFIVPTP